MLPELLQLTNYPRIETPKPITRVVQNQQDIIDLFGQAQLLWENYFSPSLLISQLSLLKKTNHSGGQEISELENNILDSIGTQRKIALLLKNAYYLFDIDHNAPQNLRRTTNRLGQIKDNIHHNNPVNMENIIVETIGILSTMSQYSLPQPFYPCDIKSYHQFYSSLIEQLAQWTKNDTTTAPELHYVRKKIIRPILNKHRLWHLLNQQEPNDTLLLLGRINQIFGHHHSKLLLAHRDGSFNYQQDVFTIHEELKEQAKKISNCSQFIILFF